METKSLPTTIGDALAYARTLEGVTGFEARALLAHSTRKERAWLLAHQEEALTSSQAAQGVMLLARLAQGEPLAYLTGVHEFHGLVFITTPDVLIPREETEELVDVVVHWAKELPAVRLVDVGTGSGIIAVTLAVLLPHAQITAVDISPEALAIARRNAEAHQATNRITFVESNLLSGVDGPFDGIVANLPYVAGDDLRTLPVAHWEPRVALDGGPDGLSAFRALISQAPEKLAPNGGVFLEIGYDQGEPVGALCREAFPESKVRVMPDLAGLDRMVIVHRGGAR
jgi:release factor glutamine methyltransferase